MLNVQRSSRAQPLVLSAEEGTPILVLFSSPERARPSSTTTPVLPATYSNPSSGCYIKMGSGYGIMLNPDSELGFDMEPETVQGLIQQLTSGEIKH